MTLEEALVSVWRQALEEQQNLIELEGRRFPVQRTSRHRLRQVDFEFGGETLRGIEQNPATKSKWAELARHGAKVMQFTSAGRFIGNVTDGEATLYRKSEPRSSEAKKGAESA